MFSAAEIAEFRADAESLMVDELDVFAPGGSELVDGLRRPTYDEMGSTAGKVQAGLMASKDVVTRTVRVGGTDRPVIEGGLHIPLSAAVPIAGDRGVGWEYCVTAVGDESDPALVGRRYLVVGVPAKSYATARRLDVVEVT